MRKRNRVNDLREISIEDEKKVQTGILNEINDFCNANGIKYYLLYGTLLGAVRHKGYIPWDDDIDIGMFRKDYNLFFECFNQYSRTKGLQYEAININTDNKYYLPMGKVVDKDTILIEDISLSYPLGVFIDVFPIDYLPDSVGKCVKIIKKVKGVKRLLSCKLSLWSNTHSLIHNLCCITIKVLLLPVSCNRLCKWMNCIVTDSNDKKSQNVGSIVFGMYGEKEIWNLDDFDKSILVEFEGKEYFAPAGLDNILHKTYGDYMTPPPIEKRISHHKNSAYWGKRVEML